jgi:outer membrane protein TolC
MKKSLSTWLGVWVVLAVAHSQSLEDVLRQVEANNKRLRAERQRLAAARVEFRTGLTPNDLQVGYDFMDGTPETAGNQVDFIVNQVFDFPTVYGNRKRVSELKTTQTGYQGAMLRREVLLEGKLLCIGLTYLNRRKAELEKRLAAAQKFSSDYQKKFDQKDASVLDLNKARLQLLTIHTELDLLDTDLLEKNRQLTELNGGVEIRWTAESYPSVEWPASFEALLDDVERTDPEAKILKTQKEIGDAQVSLSKALTLPRFEAGYRYHSILGQRFNGANFGVTLPLWEKTNTVRLQRQQTRWYELQMEEYRLALFSEVSRLYHRAAAIRTRMESFMASLTAINSTPLLDRALQAGHISTLEYFLELSLYYEAMDRFLQLEHQYHETMARLLKNAL